MWEGTTKADTFFVVVGFQHFNLKKPQPAIVYSISMRLWILSTCIGAVAYFCQHTYFIFSWTGVHVLRALVASFRHWIKPMFDFIPGKISNMFCSVSKLIWSAEVVYFPFCFSLLCLLNIYSKFFWNIMICLACFRVSFYFFLIYSFFSFSLSLSPSQHSICTQIARNVKQMKFCRCGTKMGVGRNHTTIVEVQNNFEIYRCVCVCCVLCVSCALKYALAGYLRICDATIQEPIWILKTS